MDVTVDDEERSWARADRLSRRERGRRPEKQKDEGRAHNALIKPHAHRQSNARPLNSFSSPHDHRTYRRSY
jgi:hypothetical protein